MGQMQNWLRQGIQASTAWLYRRTHRAPPPTFVRVSYCVPRQVVLLTVRHGDQDDVWPIDWHTPLSIAPQRYGVCVYRDGHGAELLRKAGVFIVNFVPDTWQKVVLACGNMSGRNVDKFTANGLRRLPGRVVATPRLDGALGCLECEVERIEDMNDRWFVVGRVLAADLVAPAPQTFHISSDVAQQ